MKKNRHKKILSLIQEYNIDRQEVLLEYLNNAGFAVTQATVSRDIKELNLVKIVSSTGEYKYAQNTIVEDTKATFNRFDYIFSESIKSVDYALNTVVIKCHTAMAQAACEVFDSLKWDGVVGTIAGDDTIMCAIRTVEDTSKVMDKISKMVM